MEREDGIIVGQAQDAGPPRRFINGTAADETLHGGGGDDWIYGGGGNDVLVGHDGDDVLIDAATGEEFAVSKTGRLYAGAGHDHLSARFGITGGFQFGGDETLNGNAGNDTVRAAGDIVSRDIEASMALIGDEGDDYISSFLSLGGRFTTILQRALGGDGSDDIVVDITASADHPAAYTTVNGGDGDDLLVVEVSSRALFSATAETRMWGGSGNDILNLHVTFRAIQEPITASLHSTLRGGPGDDWLRLQVDKPATRFETVSQRLDGGVGSDTVIGSDLEDHFVLRAGRGRDRVVDFQEGEDAFVLSGALSFESLDFSLRPGGTLITDDQGRDVAFVVGVSGLEENDFLLV